MCLWVGAVHAAERDASSIFPDSPQGKRFARLVETINSGDYARMEAFHRETDSEANAKRRAIQDYRIYLLTGGVDIQSVNQTTERNLLAPAQEKLSGLWINVVAQISPESPYAVTEIGIRPTAPPPDKKETGKLTDEQIRAKTESMLDRMSAADAFSGSALIAKDGKVIFEKAYGLASKAYQAPNKPDTKFNLASAGKMFTAVAIAQLAEQGKLSFTDTIEKHLLDYPNKEAAEKITIHQLLTHTSGLGDMFNKKFEERKDTLKTVKGFLDLFAEDKLRGEPGGRFMYSNAGFVVLGAIVEKVSGEDYYAYLQKHIFDPAGMKNTGAFEMDQDTPNLAIGYTRDGATTPEEMKDRKNNLFLHVIKGSPAGGSFSTVEDLLKFSAALQGNKLLGPEMTKLVMSEKVGAQAGEKQGYGFQVEPAGRHVAIGHRGGFPGISAAFSMYPDMGYTVAVLSNYDQVAPIVGLRIRDWIVQE